MLKIATKLMSLTLAAIMLLAVAGCDSDEGQTSNGETGITGPSPDSGESNSVEDETNQGLPLIIINTKGLFTYDLDEWPLFFPTPESPGEPHPFAGYPVHNVYQADLDGDGVYEAYATVDIGSGIVISSLLGYNPVSGEMYALNDSTIIEYEFIDFGGEMFVCAYPFSYYYEISNITFYRPKLNDETLSFDLDEVDEELAALLGEVPSMWQRWFQASEHDVNEE